MAAPFYMTEAKLWRETIQNMAGRFFESRQHIEDSGMKERASSDYWRQAGRGRFAEQALGIASGARAKIDASQAKRFAASGGSLGAQEKAEAGIGSRAIAELTNLGGQEEAGVEQGTLRGQTDLFQAMTQLAALKQDFLSTQRGFALRKGESTKNPKEEEMLWNQFSDIRELNEELGVI